MEFSFTSKYLYPTLLGDMDHWKPFFTTLTMRLVFKQAHLDQKLQSQFFGVAVT